MATSKEEVEVKLDPHLQELYDKLEDEKKKNAQFQALKKENARLTEQINQLETERATGNKSNSKKTIQRTKKKIALQEQLSEKKLQDEVIGNKQQQIDQLVESFSDQEELHDLDSKSIGELKSALDTLIQSREKRKELIKKLQKKNRELMLKNESLEFGRSNLVHDLRSLMSSILGTLSLIDLGEPEVAEELIPNLENRCQVFLGLIDTINTNEVSREDITIEDVAELISLELEGGNKIETDISGQEVPIFADKAALYDVLQNLINNSVKYSGLENSELKIKIMVVDEADSTVIRFADNGSGIAEDKQQTIFDLYNRAGLNDKDGKGIGLFMVKQLIENHDGSIIYDTEYQDGAQFVINLPKNAGSE